MVTGVDRIGTSYFQRRSAVMVLALVLVVGLLLFVQYTSLDGRCAPERRTGRSPI